MPVLTQNILRSANPMEAEARHFRERSIQANYLNIKGGREGGNTVSVFCSEHLQTRSTEQKTETV